MPELVLTVGVAELEAAEGLDDLGVKTGNTGLDHQLFTGRLDSLANLLAGPLDRLLNP